MARSRHFSPRADLVNAGSHPGVLPNAAHCPSAGSVDQGPATSVLQFALASADPPAGLPFDTEIPPHNYRPGLNRSKSGGTSFAGKPLGVAMRQGGVPTHLACNFGTSHPDQVANGAFLLDNRQRIAAEAGLSSRRGHMAARQRVVIIGGGFAGLSAARALGGGPFDVTLIDRRNFHLFQPLLYQVATGGLSPANISAPLRAIVKKQQNVNVLLAEVQHIDVAQQRVVLHEESVPYDVLIVATGSSHHYFGHPEWERWAPSLKTIEDATDIRRRVLLAFEAAEREPDVARRTAWLTFCLLYTSPSPRD